MQGVLVLKDFNIVEEAGGVGKVVVKTFPVMVKNGSLEIRLYWAGKGTVAIPVKGVYGPLISTIAIDRGKYEKKKLLAFYKFSDYEPSLSNITNHHYLQITHHYLTKLHFLFTS